MNGKAREVMFGMCMQPIKRVSDWLHKACLNPSKFPDAVVGIDVQRKQNGVDRLGDSTMPSSNWYKGNIHTHTTESVGDADPEFVTRWYMDHGYDFLVLSDHNHRTILEHEIEGGPLMIPGEEVSSRIFGGSVPIHINAIGISHVVEPTNLDDIVATLQANVNAIVNAGGIAQLNHPNYEWAFNHEHISQVEGASLLEIHNAHPSVNTFGAPGKPSTEEIWDRVLSAGRVIYGTATDDSHNYYDHTPDRSNPGRAWVVVNAPELTVDAIVEGLASGNFYSSTGVKLVDLNVSEDGMELEIEPQGKAIYVTTFSGRDGEVLSEVEGTDASYEFVGDEGYVRATIRSSNGTYGWTQPVFIKD